MLQISSGAAALLSQAREIENVPQEFGVRIYGQTAQDGQTAVGIAFTEAPEQGDEVADQEGTRLFVAPEVAAPLAEAVLDTEETPEGDKLVIKSAV